MLFAPNALKGWAGSKKRDYCWFDHPITVQPNGRRVCLDCRKRYRKEWYRAHKEHELMTTRRNRYLAEQRRYEAAWESQ